MAQSSSEVDSHEESECESVGGRCRERLIRWAVKNNVPRSHVNELLHILKEEVEVPYQIDLNIPYDYRSLLKTPRRPTDNVIALNNGGKLGFLGFGPGLEAIFKSGFNPELCDLTVLTFIDGFSPYSSHKKKFYAILNSVKEDPYRRPFLSAIYIGPETPDFNEILRPLVEEFEKYATTPFCSEHLKRNFNIKVGAFICDLIAKAQVKGTKTTGYHSCDFCTEKGVWTSHIYFPNFEFTERTDSGFRAKVNPGHHKHISILENLKTLNMVWDFPLDYMHQVLLGVGKRMMEIYFCRVKSYFKLDLTSRREMTRMFSEMQKYMPQEFEWKAEDLDKFAQFKAKEFRYLILYAGFVIFKEHLPVEHSQGLFNLSVAIRILSTPELVKEESWLNLADSLLYNFLVYVRVKLGPEQLNRNFHGLLHLVKCCRRFGSLDSFSAFPYESFLSKVGRLVVSHKHEVQQIVNRSLEASRNSEYLVNVDANSSKPVGALKGAHNKGPIIASSHVSGQYSSISLPNCTVSTTSPNNVVVLKSGLVLKVINITVSKGVSYFVGQKYLDHENHFVSPLPSSKLNIVMSKRLDTHIVEQPVSQFYRKCVAFIVDRDSTVVVLPYLN